MIPRALRELSPTLILAAALDLLGAGAAASLWEPTFATPHTVVFVPALSGFLIAFALVFLAVLVVFLPSHHAKRMVGAWGGIAVLLGTLAGWPTTIAVPGRVIAALSALVATILCVAAEWPEAPGPVRGPTS